MNTPLVTTAVIACASAACPAQVWNFSLSGLQEVPANASTGIGTGTVTYDAGTNVLSWIINWQGLSGSPIAMHFHIAPPGTNGSAGVHIMMFDTTSTGAAIGSSAAASPAFVTALLSGNTYINIHTLAFPAGEIRGQVVPAPSAVAIGLFGAGVIAPRRRR